MVKFVKPSGKIRNRDISRYLGYSENTLNNIWKRGDFNEYWSLIVGATATANGITIKDIEELIESKKAKQKIYSGVFMNDGSHVTWNFARPPAKPIMMKGKSNGDMEEVKVIGKYKDDNCTCDIVKIGDITHSPFNGNILHITRSTKGIQPYEVGVRATNNKDNIEWFDKEKTIVGFWGFHMV
jgi:hypothetical protein